MANAAAKRLAASNAAALSKLHKTAAAVYISVIALLLIRHRSVVRLIVMSSPAFVLQYVLEKTCRPVYASNQLVRPGQDIRQQGLTEYMHDVIYITWICSVLSALVGNKAWYLYLSIPGFAVYKGWGLFQWFRNQRSPQNQQGSEPEAQKTTGASNSTPQLSKRQEKRQKLQSKRQNS